MDNQKRCDDLDAAVSAYVDHEATTEEVAIVEAHALTCRACAARVGHHQTLTARLEADVPAGRANAETAGVRANRRRFRAPHVRRLSRPAMVAVLLAMTVLAAVALLRSAPAVEPADTAIGAQATAASAESKPAPVLVASIDGIVDPAVAAYVHRAVSAAEDAHAGALVLVLDASGGLDASMRQVASELANSSVPTLAFVAPGHASAADATLAQSSALDVASTPSPTVDALLRAVDGRQARTPAGVVSLATAGARIDALEMEPLEALAHRLMDPTTAYLLFVLGLYCAFVELAHPGSLLPGATSLLCLTGASISLAILPTNWLGAAVLVAAVGLMALELKAATQGALVLAGVVCLILGSVLLYSAPGSLLPVQAEITVAPGVLVGAAATGLIVGLLLARIARRIHSLRPILSLEELIGARGTSRGGLDPEGVVYVGGQLWSARLRVGRLESGQPVRVVARRGLVLEVESVALGAATRKGTFS